MSTALALATIALPADLVSVSAGEVDDDGRDELVLVSRHDNGTETDTITLTVIHVGPDGREEDRQTLPLGSTPRFWDIHSGIWLVDGEGVARLHLDGRVERIAALPTPLAGLGPSTPHAADIAHDLDDDGTPEILVWSNGVLHVVSADGSRKGAIAAPAEGALRTRGQAGATGLVASSRLPALTVGDLDGDGDSDVLFPEEDTARLVFTDGTAGARVATAQLPLDLEHDDRQGIDRDKEERRVAQAWWTDLDGDARLDLLVHRTVTRGSWFGSTAELLVARGTGAGYSQTQAMETEHAAVDVILVDFEGDGDQDLLVPQVDVNLGNLASALISKSVKIQSSLYVMEDGRYPAEPVELRKFKVSIDDSDALQLSVDTDVTGDGIVDLVSNGSQDIVQVHPGSLYGFAEDPAYELAVPVPRGDDRIHVHDLTGDGRAEMFVWGVDVDTGSLLWVP